MFFAVDARSARCSTVCTMNAKFLVDTAVRQLDALAQQALLEGHTGLAAFLNKRSSEVHYAAPTRDRVWPDNEHREWVPDRKGDCAALPLGR